MPGGHPLSCESRPMGATLVTTAAGASSASDERSHTPRSAHAGGEHASRKLPMPFLLVATQTPTYVDCAMSSDQGRALLTFQHQFSIHDDSEVLRCLGLHRPATEEVLSQLLSPELVRFANGLGPPTPSSIATPRESV